MSARSVEVLHTTVKAAFQLAIDKGQLVRNPGALATAPAVVDQRHTWWTPEQVGAFLAYLAEHGGVPVGLVDVLVDTGGRRGEVLALRWGDVDLDAGTATVARQLVEHPETRELYPRPTKRPRAKSTVGLHPDTVAGLRRRPVEQSEDRLKMGRRVAEPVERSRRPGVHVARRHRHPPVSADPHHRPAVGRSGTAEGDTPGAAAQLRDGGAQGAGAGLRSWRPGSGTPHGWCRRSTATSFRPTTRRLRRWSATCSCTPV